MLWNDSQETWKDFLKRCYTNWTNKEGITKEAAADEVVKLHNAQDGAAKTGLHFNPASVTEANRLKANCATLTRHLDKEELFELLPYILGAMGEEQRLAFASQYLRPAGLTVRLLDNEEAEDFNLEVLHDTQRAAFGAIDAMTNATLNPTPENLEIAEREAAKATEKFKRTRAFLTKARNACSGARSVIGKLVHRKDKVPA